MKTRTVAIVQARMGSTRFPGKMLAQLGGIPLLEWVVRRLACATTVDQIVVATSDSEDDNTLADLAITLGIPVYRGSENDVLARFIGAATMSNATSIVRVCADNPFIDPDEVNRLVNYFARHKCDYTCNHQDRLGSGYADGFGAEIFTLEVLKKIAALAKEQYYREHATSYLWDHISEYKLTTVEAPVELSFPEMRFDVDTKDDLLNLEALVRAGVDIKSSAHDIIRIAQVNQRISSINFNIDVSAEIDSYLQRLFPLCRSITGEPNRKTLKILQEIAPLQIKEYPSGTPVYDWTVPDEWNLRNAWIKDVNGNKLVDIQDSNIHLVSYSEPFHGKITFDELKKHIHIHSDIPEAIPYRTSYYRRDWGFCVTHAQYKILQNNQGALEVFIDSDLDNKGSLSIGELLILGESEEEILLSTYICHPSLANDNLSGMVMTAFLARELLKQPKQKYSYRILWVPETIGAIAYSAMNERAMKKIKTGLIITTVGGSGKFGYKKSFDERNPINASIEEVFKEEDIDYLTYPFDIHGSDERQYSSQGFRVNVASITKDKYYEYPYYHSSLDNLDFIKPEYLNMSLLLHLKTLSKLQEYDFTRYSEFNLPHSIIQATTYYKSLYPNCEVMLSKHNLYPATGGAQIPIFGDHKELDLILWLFFWADGQTAIEEIAHKINVGVEELKVVAEKLVNKKLLTISKKS